MAKISEEGEAMLKPGSRELQTLLPHVLELHRCTAALKAAVVGKDAVGAAKRQQLQSDYLKATRRMCLATVKLCDSHWWPQLFIAAYRSTHPGRAHPLVDPEVLKGAFKGLISDNVLHVIVAQATKGQEVYLSRPTVSSWPNETPTARMFKEEIWRTVWIDVAYGSTFVFGPDCQAAMTLARMQGYPLHRIPKRDTATGLPTGKGRLVSDLSYVSEHGFSINSVTLLGLYDKFHMPRHSDIARDILVLRHWFPRLKILIAKLDVARAFRQKILSIGSFGVFAFRLGE
jgi:hypothetical protein